MTERLQKMGIAGHQTTAGADRQLETAKAVMATIQQKVLVADYAMVLRFSRRECSPIATSLAS